MAYVLKLLGAKCMRSIVSLVVKLKTPSQSAPPKPALTLHLERLTQGHQQRRRRQSPIRVDVYLPIRMPSSTDSSTTLPVVINLHGSGFVFSTFGDDARFCQLMADQVQCAVLDVAYRKAPENPYPSANEDAESVLDWIREKKEIDEKLAAKGVAVYADRVGITGFSSGGNLALTTCVRAKGSEKSKMIRAVVAFYPSTNLAESPYEKPNMKPEKGEAGAVMPPFVRQFLYSCYVPASQDTPRSSPFISPVNAGAEDFPESVTIITCQGDSLAREGQQTALKIRRGRQGTVQEGEEKVLEEVAGNGVLCWEAKGQGHNWDKMCADGSEAAKKRDYAYALCAERLKSALQ